MSSTVLVQQETKYIWCTLIYSREGALVSLFVNCVIIIYDRSKAVNRIEEIYKAICKQNLITIHK